MVRLHYPGEIRVGALLDLPEHTAHHALRVLRLRPGERVAVFNGQGGEWHARITEIHKARAAVQVLEHVSREVESPLPIVLAQAISARERMDLTIEKAVELGVSEIQPIESRRSVVKLRDERASRRIEHWQNMVYSACEQCGRNRIPVVHPIENLPTWLGALPRPSQALRLMLSPNAEDHLRQLPAPSSVVLLVGPEGGFDDDERDLAQLFGFTAVRLGPRVLRTETAALAAISAMHALWGDF
ncbi:MAG TPA: 16S rRNA (uracil(1498)-N(3))-methyltransferase [Burkholderiales bacterium]|nr:16S rRNA (uracil(1498)-N(3))-methyltransferase [Burkholderiales bacterium]